MRTSKNVIQHPAAEQAKPKFKVSENLLALSKVNRKSNQEKLTREKSITNIFIPPIPPPGVLPKGDNVRTLANDEAISDSFNWAFANAALSSAWAEGQVFPGYADLSLLAVRPEYRVVAETLSSEQTREWIEFISVSGDKNKDDKIKELDKGVKERFKCQDVARKAILHDALFGRGHIFIDCCDIEDREELQTDIGDGRSVVSTYKILKEGELEKEGEKPEARDGKEFSTKAGHLKKFKNVEPIWCYPTQYNSTDPLHDDWYKPPAWFVMGKQVHSSRLLTLVSKEVPDLLKPAYSFGGLSSSQMMRPYVDNWLKIRQAVADLIQAFTVFVLSTDLSSLMSTGDTDLIKRLEFFANIKNNLGIMALNKDSEEFQNISAPLSGLEQLQAQAQEHMATPARIPLVKLFGIQPAGLNASSEGEIRVFYDNIKSSQEAFVRNPLTIMINFVQLSLWGEIDDDISYNFKGLWQLDEAGNAAVEKTKADIDTVYMSEQVVSPEEIRQRLANDKNSIYQGLDLDKSPPPIDEQKEMEEMLGLGGELNEEKGLEEPKPKDPNNRLANQLTNKAAGFGGAVSGGFKGDLGIDEFHEEDHPRGQPDNPGQFAKTSGGSSKSQHLVSEVDRSKWPSHIKRLRIPPAWTDVKISPDPKTPLQAVGKDAKGRFQYVYSAKFKNSQTEKKFARIKRLDNKFPAIERQNTKALDSKDPIIREHALVTSLIMDMGLRPGSERETGAEKQAYGATTLKSDHVVKKEDGLYLQFVGKKGVDLDLPITDKTLAEKIETQAKTPGPLFTNVSDSSLRRYIGKLGGGGFKTKDLRTLKGTSLAQEIVSQMDQPSSQSAYKKAVRSVAETVSKKLGNTPAVALQAYISPVVFAAWQKGLIGG